MGGGGGEGGFATGGFGEGGGGSAVEITGAGKCENSTILSDPLKGLPPQLRQTGLGMCVCVAPGPTGDRRGGVAGVWWETVEQGVYVCVAPGPYRGQEGGVAGVWWETVAPYVKYRVRSPKFIWAPVSSCTHWLRPRNSRPPPHLGSYTRALLVSQDRRHLFVTP